MTDIPSSGNQNFQTASKVERAQSAKQDFSAYYSKTSLNVCSSHSAKLNNEDIARYLESGLVEPRERNPEISGRFRYNQADEEDKRSSNHSFKTDLPRRNSMQMGSLGDMASTNSSSIPKLPKIAKPGLGFNIKSSLELKPERKNSYQASKRDTAQHLEFLNLFQQRLKKINRK